MRRDGEGLACASADQHQPVAQQIVPRIGRDAIILSPGSPSIAVGRHEDVGIGALIDLLRQGIGAAEGQGHLGPGLGLIGVGHCLHGVGERGGGEDRDARAGACA